MGADLSYVNAIEDAGGVYRKNNQPKDPFVLLKEAGCNTVRVRLWHNPARWQSSLNGGRIYHHLEDVTKTIRRAKAAGMAVNLDIHYSDDWADPQKQFTPKAWENLPLAPLADSVHQYTLSVLLHLKNQNLVPEMVQVGNENNGGILWPVGKIENNDYSAFATLLNSGIKAVRDFSKTSTIKPRIILHVAQFQDAMPWLKGIMSNGVIDFDILGVSHYYKWSKVNNMDSITQAIADLKRVSNREVMVVETAFPFTNVNADKYNNIFYAAEAAAVGYPFSVSGQRQYFTNLTKAIVKGGGTGIMVWEPAWITSKLNDRWGIGSSWENNTYFLYDGNMHDGALFMLHDYKN
jgi:arabinogalactan endo-1,4-beta-galactosidase